MLHPLLKVSFQIVRYVRLWLTTLDRQRFLELDNAVTKRPTIKSTFELGKMFNILPEGIKCMDDNKFKIKQKSFLLDVSDNDIKGFIMYCNCYRNVIL